MDKFSEPEQFDAEVEIHGGEPFAVWSPAVNGSHVKKEQYFALLAELEAKDRRIIGLERHVKDIEATLMVAADEVADLTKERDEARAKLATPVRLPNKNDDEFWFDSVFQVAKFDRAVERAISAVGFKVEGDE